MVSTSKWVTWVLRHGAAELGLQKRPGGWLKIAELEAVGRTSESEIISILQHDTVGRYNAFCLRGDFWIRADPNRRRSVSSSLPVVPPPPPEHHHLPQQQELYPADPPPPPQVLGSGHASAPPSAPPMTMMLPRRHGTNLPTSSVWSGSFIGSW